MTYTQGIIYEPDACGDGIVITLGNIVNNHEAREYNDTGMIL